ncbi:hypothetical protein [Leifsonia sp. Leaf264]|uniref:hypothetical protein n=1 Tax=Leifsonia sp. Leaf264 TaxID=1736314 RepID=UPI0006F78E27|nr:hypothetical protein [Leifsonia sp. Leaf264]KQP01482.1 hypothetical protein ASF30_02370 [Leifsonia sp. Leaf264]
MTDEQIGLTPRLQRILTTEEAVYGLILVSGMIVLSGTTTGTSVDALITVIVTVLIFFAAHVYADTLARLAASAGQSGIRASLLAAIKQSSGLLAASVIPIAILTLGTTDVVEDRTAIWLALIANTVLLGALGWIAVARWSSHWTARVLGALITASFGGALILLKVLVPH